MNRKYSLIVALIIFCNLIFASARIVYTRPGLMMRVPTSSVQNAPYVFRTGFGVELHNFDPINTAKGVYFDMEFSKGFTAGFSAVQGGDTTALDFISKSQYSPQVEFGFHFQQRIFIYNNSWYIFNNFIIFTNCKPRIVFNNCLCSS